MSVLVLDFDGTMTDAEQEGAPFRTGYLEDLALLTGLSYDEVDSRARAIEAEVLADPHAHGWLFLGRIVAPATVDPYLRMMPVARRVFDEAGIFPDTATRTRLLDDVLYKYNYQKTTIAFREGARDTLLALPRKSTFVVTNSHPGPVTDKLRALGGDDGALDWLIPHVHGTAKKYVIDDTFDAVPAHLTLPGLDRPVLLRRRLYHDRLAGLVNGCGVGFESLIVVGDIFELDLALPLALGAQVVLVTNGFTPDYERAFVASEPRAHAIGKLAELPALIERIA